MKKIFLMAAILLIGITVSQGQTTAKEQPSKAPVSKATPAKATVATKQEPTKPTGLKATSTPVKGEAKPAVKEEPKAEHGSGTHLKKDGTPDKRYKENKASKASMKKDGTPDKRYKENKEKAAATPKK